MSVSSIILTKNEETNISGLIKSLSFSDEIIVVDDFSTDRTVEIARKLKAVVFERPLKNDFSAQRNFGLAKANSEWVFFIDADESPSPELIAEMQKAKQARSGYYIARKNVFLGKVVGEEKVLRFAKKNAGRWTRHVHEVWEVGGKVGKLKGSLVHNTASSLRAAIAKTNYYSNLNADEKFRSKRNASVVKILFFPLAKLLQNLLTGKGFVFGFLHSFHSFLSWSKLWLLQRN